MKITGNIVVRAIDPITKKEIDKPISNTIVVFTNTKGVAVNSSVTNDKGLFTADLPNEEYSVQAYVVGSQQDIVTFRQGDKFKVDTTTVAGTSFNLWLNNKGDISKDPLVDYLEQLSKETAENARLAKQHLDTMRNNSIGNANGKWLKEGASKSDCLKTFGAYYSQDIMPQLEAGDTGLSYAKHFKTNNIGLDFSGTEISETEFLYYEVQKNYNNDNARIIEFKGYRGRAIYAQAYKRVDGTWTKPVVFYNQENAKVDKNNVLHATTGTPKDTLLVGDYGLGSTLTLSGNLFDKDVSGFYRDQSSTRGYPSSSNLNTIILGYGKTRMNGIAFQATSNEAWIFNDTTKVFNKIVTQDTNGAIEYKSNNNRGLVSKITNIGGVKKDDYVLTNGWSHFIITSTDGKQSRWTFPFKEGSNTVGEDASKSGIGLTRSEHVTFPADTPNDDKIKALMLRGNGIYRMIGNVGNASNPVVLTMHSSDGDVEVSSLFAVDIFRNRVGVAFKKGKNELVVQGDFYTTLNTTVDSNGFIKKASPIIKLFDDHIEWNQDFKEEPVFEKLGVGVYKISNTNGLARGIVHGDWYIEIPKNRNGLPYFMVEWEQDDITDDVIIKVFDRKFDINIGDFINGEPRDIGKDERWIDLRFFEKIYSVVDKFTMEAPYRPENIKPYIRFYISDEYLKEYDLLVKSFLLIYITDILIR